MVNEKNTFEYISRVDEILEISKFMNSELVDKALDKIVHVVSNPDIPPQTASSLIVHLQAISSVCAMQASYYKNLNPGKAGSEEYKLKNLYFSLHESLNELTNALKYLCK